MPREAKSEGEIGDYFRPNLLALRNNLSQEDFRRFSSLRRNSERVAFVLSRPEARQLSLEVHDEGSKSSEKALQLKEVGNKFFAHGAFMEALETYSNAVLLAPKKDLPIILANRSATLLHAKQYQYSISDIEEALRVGYPRELRYKLEERRARCFLALKRYEEAIEAFRTTLTVLDDAKVSPEKKQKLETDIRIMLSFMNEDKRITTRPAKPRTKPTDSKNPRIPRILERNPSYPACSKSVSIKDEGGHVGRHAVAACDIMPGDLLVVEEPHCAFLLAEHRRTHCHSCFTRIFAPIPPTCGLCSCVAYCGIACRNADAKLHERVCNLLPALWLSKASITCFLALKAIIQQPYEKVMRLTRDQLESSSKGTVPIDEKRPYRGKDYARFYSLVTHEDERSVEDIFHRAYMAGWLLRLLKMADYLPADVKTADLPGEKLSNEELHMADLLLHNLQLLQFNSHEISELVIPRDSKNLDDAKSIFVGGGVYPTVALFNHSCNPGIIRYFTGTTMIVRAIRTIRKGEEISENYGPIFTITPREERKRKLRLQYWFECNCEACVDHWPLLQNLDPTVLRFKCETGQSCKKILLVNTNAETFMIKCSNCGKSTNILKGLKALQDTDMLFKVASRDLNEGNYKKALDSYLKILKLLDETLALPIKDYHLCQQFVRLCMLALGNVSS